MYAIKLEEDTTMKRILQTALFVAFFATATLLTGCNAASLAGPDDAPQAQSCEGDHCSNGHNL